ncbi:MAG: ATP-binding protein, partial [Chloroflexi bacterium]|nr:ATP-binding protein [Chloroflexota bacterium]
KTKWIYELIRYSKGVYFLARPRRFGKSLLIATLQEIFEGNRELFRGLWLYDSPYQWDSHPVIRVDFSRQPVKSADELETTLQTYVSQIAQRHGVTLQEGRSTRQLEDLIAQLSARNKVVILIDEYDKPILDNIENVAEAGRIRDVLKGFYTVIKSLDAYLRFVFLTGVSKFSKVGVFSGLNNLNDVSLDSRYAAMLGITQAELERDFPAHLRALAERQAAGEAALLAQIRHWYDGFCFSEECQPVYNPFSLLLLFETRTFRNFWFESGTPTFLIKLIRQRNYDVRELDRLEIGELGFSSYEIDDLKVIPLLLQTGYLTIKAYDKATRLYTLAYPNYEVEHAFLHYLVGAFSAVDETRGQGYLWQLIRALQAGDLERFFSALQVFFADVPYDIQLRQEKYYQTIFYLIFRLIGLEVAAEVRTERGRIDAVVELAEQVFVFEFKLDGSAEAALAQIREREYAQKYRGRGKAITLVGVAFSMASRGIEGWQAQSI